MTLIQEPVALVLLTSAAAGAVGAVSAALPYRRKVARVKAEALRLKWQLNSVGQSLRDAAELAEAREQEERHLAEVRLPALIRGLWEGGGAGGSQPVGMLDPRLAQSLVGQAHESVLKQVTVLVEAASVRAEDAARTAVLAVAQSLQNLSQEQLEAVDKVLQRHHGSDVLADLMPVDHSAAQLARRAEGVLVLAGKWPGVKREDSPLLEAVRGGVSRIKDYARVQIADAPPYYVTSGEVQPLVLIVAELLDNAARYSAPGTAVYVRFVDAHNGVTVEIDDAGIGMTPEVLGRAKHLLSGQDPVRLTELSNPPQLGHLLVGSLAARYGVTVTVRDSSSYGGISANIYVPRTLLTAPPAEDSVPAVPAYAGTGAEASTGPAAPAASPRETSRTYEIAADGLPVRVRKDPDPRRTGPAAPPASRPPTDGGLSAAAFLASWSQPAPHPSTDEENTQ